MPRKIYDVVPPKVANKLENTVKSLGAKKPRKKRTVKQPAVVARAVKAQAAIKRQSGAKWKIVALAGALMIVAAGIYAFVKLPKAMVEIYPAMETVTLDENITADKTVNS